MRGRIVATCVSISSTSYFLLVRAALAPVQIDASTERIQTVGLVSPGKAGQIALPILKLRTRGERFPFVSLILLRQ